MSNECDDERDQIAARHYGASSVADYRWARERYRSGRPIEQPTAAERNEARLAVYRAKIDEAEACARDEMDRRAKAARDYRRYREHLRKLQFAVCAGGPIPAPTVVQPPFRYTFAQLLDAAAVRSVKTKQHNVKSFARWVHSLYDPPNINALTAQHGKQMEREIASSALRLAPAGIWTSVYRDPLHPDRPPPPLSIPKLAVNGIAMRGAPDNVLRHHQTGDLAVIEVKSSKPYAIPLSGWPDVRAQLWCYGQIDKAEWHAAPVIRLIAEVWISGPNGPFLRVNDGGLLRWLKDDPTFNEENEALFAIYRRKLETRGVRLEAATVDDEGHEA